MTVFTAHVENGAVVLDTPMSLPDGARLRVELVEQGTSSSNDQVSGSTLGERLLKYAGTVRGLPHDLAKQHDHYIHGVEQR